MPEELLRDRETDPARSDPVNLTTVPGPGEVEEIEIDRLSFELSPRERANDQEHLNTLIDLFPRLPPILVHAPTMKVIDGVYRVMAARALGMPTLRATLVDGTEADAFVRAVRCNVAHGKPLNLREREAAAATVLADHAGWSDRLVAKVCGLSPTTVGRIRNLQGAKGTGPARMGRDGKARPVDPIELRRGVAEMIKAFPTASNREIASRCATSQGTVRDVRARLRDGRQVARALEIPLRAPEDNAVTDLHNDAAYVATKHVTEFTRWLDAHLVRDDQEWQQYVVDVPMGRVYEVADAARRCGESWHRLASAMEGQAKRRSNAET